MEKLPKGLLWRGGVIHCNFKLKGRPRVRRSLDTANVAEAIRLRDDLRSEAYTDKYWKEEKTVTVREMIFRHLNVLRKRTDPKLPLEHRLKDFETIENRLLVLDELIGTLYYDQMDSEVMTDLVQNLYDQKAELQRRGHKKLTCGSTINRYMSALSGVFIAWNKDHEEQIRNPVVVHYEFPKETPRDRLLSDIERSNLLGGADTRIKSLVLAAMWTGMREGEILQLRWSDIDFQKHVINIRAETTKDKEARMVPMFRDPKKPGTHLEKMLFERWLGRQGPFVFGREDGRKAEWSYYRDHFGKTLVLSEIQDFHFHDLRHTFIADHIMAGTDLKTIATYVGHASTAMIERIYGRLEKAQVHLHKKMQSLSTMEEMAAPPSVVTEGD